MFGVLILNFFSFKEEINIFSYKISFFFAILLIIYLSGLFIKVKKKITLFQTCCEIGFW